MTTEIYRAYEAIWTFIQGYDGVLPDDLDLSTYPELAPFAELVPSCRLLNYHEGEGEIVDEPDVLLIHDTEPDSIPEGVKLVVYLGCRMTHSLPLPESVIMVGYQRCEQLTVIKDLPSSVQKLYMFEWQAFPDAVRVQITLPPAIRSATIQTDRPIRFQGKWPATMEELALIGTKVVKSQFRAPASLTITKTPA